MDTDKIMAYFKLESLHSHAQTEENHDT